MVNVNELYNTVHNFTVQYTTSQYNTAQLYSIAHTFIVQYTTLYFSTQLYSTVHNTVKLGILYSTVMNNIISDLSNILLCVYDIV